MKKNNVLEKAINKTANEVRDIVITVSWQDGYEDETTIQIKTSIKRLIKENPMLFRKIMKGELI